MQTFWPWWRNKSLGFNHRRFARKQTCSGRLLREQLGFGMRFFANTAVVEHLVQNFTSHRAKSYEVEAHHWGITWMPIVTSKLVEISSNRFSLGIMTKPSRNKEHIQTWDLEEQTWNKDKQRLKFVAGNLAIQSCLRRVLQPTAHQLIGGPHQNTTYDMPCGHARQAVESSMESMLQCGGEESWRVMVYTTMVYARLFKFIQQICVVQIKTILCMSLQLSTLIMEL